MSDRHGATANNTGNNHSNHHRSYSASSNHARGPPSSPSSARTPPRSFATGASPKRHMSPHHSGAGAGSGVFCLSSAAAAVAEAAAAAAKATAPPPPPTSRTPPNHHHHLRERGAPRTRFDDEDDDDEDARAARAARGRRNRPRSSSMPEGMELQARVSLSLSGGGRNDQAFVVVVALLTQRSTGNSSGMCLLCVFGCRSAALRLMEGDTKGGGGGSAYLGRLFWFFRFSWFGLVWFGSSARCCRCWNIGRRGSGWPHGHPQPCNVSLSPSEPPFLSHNACRLWLPVAADIAGVVGQLLLGKEGRGAYRLHQGRARGELIEGGHRQKKIVTLCTTLIFCSFPFYQVNVITRVLGINHRYRCMIPFFFVSFFIFRRILLAGSPFSAQHDGEHMKNQTDSNSSSSTTAGPRA